MTKNRLENLEDVNQKIAALIRGGGGFIVGRNGSTEMGVLLGYQTPEKFLTGAGIFPISSVAEWRRAYLNTFLNLRICATGWYKPLAEEEALLVESRAPDALQIPLRGLEPYYIPAGRWTAALDGKRVAVVSSFARTAVTQAAAAGRVWGSAAETLLPSSATWIPVVTGFPPALSGPATAWPTGVNGWADAVRHCVDAVVAARCDVALIGCGALGMLIADGCRRNGIGAIVMGGAIQVLFGIKGSRWATHDVIGKFWNDAWVWPAADETPIGAGAIESACYWQRV